MSNYEVVLNQQAGSIYQPELETDSPHQVYLYPGTGCTNLILNGGASNTTDWVYSGATPIGDYWVIQGGLTPTIVTGSGFTGNAQRCVPTYTQTNTNIYNQSYLILSSTNYRITFKYRASFALQCLIRDVGGGGWTPLATMSANTGDAISSGVINVSTGSGGNLAFGVLNSETVTTSDWFEIDEINCCIPA